MSTLSSSGLVFNRKAFFIGGAISAPLFPSVPLPLTRILNGDSHWNFPQLPFPFVHPVNLFVDSPVLHDMLASYSTV